MKNIYRGDLYMKRVLVFLLMLCMLLGCFTSAFAKLEILEQPVSQTVKERGKATFSFKVAKQQQMGITWYFVNPDTGEEITGKNIRKTFKGLKVTNPNSQKMTLRNIPAAMHGWSLYARCKANGATVETDIVQILIEGMDPPDIALPKRLTAVENKEAPEETAVKPEPSDEAETEAPSPESAEKKDSSEETESTKDNQAAEQESEPAVINITASNALLYPVNAKGKTSEEGSASMSFTGSASFYVAPASEGEIQYWTINGVRVEPDTQVPGFTFRGVTSDMAVSVKIKKASSDASADLDYQNMCKITCSNCFFTFMPAGITYAAEGEVPAGAKITVIAGQGADLEKGYTINSEAGQQQNKVTFTMVVEADTSISMN